MYRTFFLGLSAIVSVQLLYTCKWCLPLWAFVRHLQLSSVFLFLAHILYLLETPLPRESHLYTCSTISKELKQTWKHPPMIKKDSWRNLGLESFTILKEGSGLWECYDMLVTLKSRSIFCCLKEKCGTFSARLQARLVCQHKITITGAWDLTWMYYTQHR